MRATLSQTSFTGGVLSPRLHGHVNMDRYGSSVKDALNCHPVLHGGMKRRGGSRFALSAAATAANASVLVPFIVGRDLAFLLEFSNLSVRVIDPTTSAVVTTLPAPYSVSVLRDLDWAQSDSTMYLFHPEVPIHWLRRLSATTWVLEPLPLTQAAYDESGYLVDGFGTLSNATVGTGRTLTATAPIEFREADVGRAVISGGGLAVITGFTSTSQVTVTITREFASTALVPGQWTLDASPLTSCSPSAVGPVGASITLITGLTAWRPADVNSIVKINGGVVRITGYSSGTTVNATVLQVLSGTVTAPSLSWSLEPLIWSPVYGYPRTGTVYQQRLIAAGSRRYPRTVWGSRVGEPFDFERGEADDLGFAFTIDGDEASPICYVSALDQLAVFTESAEYTMRGGVEKPITPTNVAITPASGHGCAAVRPQSLDGEVAFVQRAGRKVRAFGYNYDFRRYEAQDITVLAEHLTLGGVLQLVYQREPDQLLWARKADGTLLSCTVDRGQTPGVIAWSPHSLAGGVVESLAVLPGASSDVLWLIVRRVVNGLNQRFIERLDETLCPFHPTVNTTQIYGNTLDCALVIDNDPGVSSFTAAHLPNTPVRVVADGTDLGTFTTNGVGAFTLPRTAKRVIVGLHFDSWFDPLNPEIPTPGGSSQGQPARTGETFLHLLDSVGGVVVSVAGNRQELPVKEAGAGVLRPLGGASVANAPVMVRGLVKVNTLGWDRGESSMRVLQDKPYPMHVLALIRGHQVNPK